MRLVVASQQDGKDVGVGRRDDIRHDEPAAEAQQLAHWPQVDAQRWPPAGEPVVKHADRQREDDILRGQAPIGKALIGHDDAHHARQCHRHQRDDAALAYHHVPEDIGTRRNAEADEEEAEERVARQPREARLVIEAGNERSREEKQQIESHADEDAHPEHGVIVALRHFLLAVQGSNEASLLHAGSNGRENGQHAHHAVILLRELTRQDDSEHQPQQLLQAVAEASPKQAFGCLLLQRSFHHRFSDSTISSNIFCATLLPPGGSK